MASTSNEISTRPLSYIDWVKTASASVTSESDLFVQYNTYLTEWYIKSNLSETEQQSQIQNVYRDLLRDITLNYSSPDEKRVLTQIDYTNPAELDIIIPYYVTKLKQVTQYVVDKRQEVQFSSTRHNLKGSEIGLVTLLKNEIVTTLKDRSFIEKYYTSNIPAVSSVVNQLTLEIEPLYDIYQNYFDIDPGVDKSTYVSHTSSSDTLVPDNITTHFNSRQNAFGSNTERHNIHAFTNLSKAIELLFEEIPTFLHSEDGGIATSDGCCLAVNVKQTDLADLPYNHFVNGDKTQDSLVTVHQRNLTEKYGGTKMYYLSTGSTTTDIVSGVLFDPRNKSANILNRYTSSHVTSPDLSNLKTIRDIGGFFISSKLGMLNYATLDSRYTLDKSKLVSNTVYIFPDPDTYQGGRGNTKIDHPTPYNYIDDVSKVKSSHANHGDVGTIVNDTSVHKFYPYQSREETLHLQPHGMSRLSDNIDFWEGDEKDIWANADMYPEQPLTLSPITDKLTDLLVSDESVDRWKTDIYGNEYAIYKSIHIPRVTLNQENNNLVSSTVQDATSQLPTRDLFESAQTAFYNYQLSSYSTVLEPQACNILTADRTIYQKRYNDTGSVLFRNVVSSTIGPLSSTLSAVFIKYNPLPDILSEIYHSVINFDIIEDIIVLETANFLVFEQIKYNYDDNSVSSGQNKLLYVSLSGKNTKLEKFANIWYDDDTQDIMVSNTVLHPNLSASNLKVIYPQIFKYNIKHNTFEDVYTLKTILSPDNVDKLNDDIWTYHHLRSLGYSLSGTGEEIDIVELDKPTVSHNKRDSLLAFNYIGRDVCRNNYIHTVYISTGNPKKYNLASSSMFKTNYTVLNYNLNHYNALSAYFESPLDRGSVAENSKVSWHSFITEEVIGGNVVQLVSQDSEVSFAQSFSPTGLSGSPVNNPSHTMLTEYNTAYTGTALSGNSEGHTLSSSDVLPYSHNTSYLLYNVPLSAKGGTSTSTLGNHPDIEVCFDVALYTYTPTNSAYKKVFTSIQGIQRENGVFILTEDGFVLYQD